MNRAVPIAALALLVFLVGIVATRFWLGGAAAPLTLFLRCDPEVQGTLTIGWASEDNPLLMRALSDVCDSDGIDIEGYDGMRELSVRLAPATSAAQVLILTRDHGISTSNTSFYAILHVSDTRPHLRINGI